MGVEPPSQPSFSITPVEAQILLALAGGERHGYAIMQEVRANSDETLRLGPGTLYAALKRLLLKGLIEEIGEQADPALSPERRRFYALTPSGRSTLTQELERLERIVELARSRNLLPAPSFRLAPEEP
jgi:DNA-binding PadR family transcriptional regulator